MKKQCSTIVVECVRLCIRSNEGYATRVEVLYHRVNGNTATHARSQRVQ